VMAAKAIDNITTARRVQAAANATEPEQLLAHGGLRTKGQIAACSQEVRATDAGISPRTQRKLDHLAAHRPDLMAQVRAGAMKPG
jgi:hypothetical protein